MVPEATYIALKLEPTRSEQRWQESMQRNARLQAALDEERKLLAEFRRT